MMISSEGERPLKKRRYGIFSPFVATGPVSLSRSSSLTDSEYLTKLLTLHDVETDTLFFPNANAGGDPDNIEVGQSVRRALRRHKDKEEKLRNAVYTELKLEHGVQFPTSSARWNIEMKLRTKANFDHRYKETDLAHLLHEFHSQRERENNESEEEVNMILHGLNVTTTPLPDITVLRGKYPYFGEFKNNEKYTNDHAAKHALFVRPSKLLPCTNGAGCEGRFWILGLWSWLHP